MGKFLFVAFLVMPLVELAAIIQVAGWLDVLPTIALLLAVSVVGAWLVRAQGFHLLQRLNAEVGAGKMPTKTLIDGALVVLGGSLLLTPGFITDAVGLALQLPPFRALIRPLITRSLARRVEVRATNAGFGPMFGSGGPVWFGGGTGQGASGRPGQGAGPSRHRPGTGDVIDADVVSDEVVDDDPDGSNRRGLTP